MEQAGEEIKTAAENGREGKRGNDLDGAEWTRCSISIWSDIRKTAEENALKHPAMFPVMLVERVIRCFTRDDQKQILDPFSGSGSTLIAAHRLGRRGIGFEVCPEYVSLTRQRLDSLGADPAEYRLYDESAQRIPQVLEPESVDLCVTSPPYWNILSQKRSADYKEIREYGPGEDDLSRLADYTGFLDRLAAIFHGVYRVLKPGAYCVVNVMDLRKKACFYPFHSDLAGRLAGEEHGGRFIYDDLIIWDRRADYNNLRPLGYPAVFRVNKVHEFLLIFRKPRGTE
jgi:DNA modification methylase